MDEYLTPVNDGQVSDEGSQTAVETEQAVNADDAEVTTGEQEQTVEGGKPNDTDAQEQTAEEPRTQTKEENELFAKVRRDAEASIREEFAQRQAARDAEFAETAAQFGWVDSDGNPIQTEEAYWKAVKTQKRLDELVTQGKDPEAARAIIERDELKSKVAEIERVSAENARRDAENVEFVKFYEKATGKEFTHETEIPQSVFDTAKERGITLQHAFAEHLALTAKEKEKSLALGKQTSEVNAKNAAASTGSVTGTPPSDFVTAEEIASHSNDTAWAIKNYDKIMKFYEQKKG